MEHTDRTEFSMVLPNTLDGMQLHIDSLTRSQFCQHNVRIGGCQRISRKYFVLLSCRHPYEMRRKKLMVDIKLMVLRSPLRCVWVSLASEIDMKHDGVTIHGLISWTWRKEKDKEHLYMTDETTYSFS